MRKFIFSLGAQMCFGISMKFEDLADRMVKAEMWCIRNARLGDEIAHV